MGGAVIQATELAFSEFQEKDAHLNTSVHDRRTLADRHGRQALLQCDFMLLEMHSKLTRPTSHVMSCSCCTAATYHDRRTVD
jgi:hypothetical protein